MFTLFQLETVLSYKIVLNVWFVPHNILESVSILLIVLMQDENIAQNEEKHNIHVTVFRLTLTSCETYLSYLTHVVLYAGL